MPIAGKVDMERGFGRLVIFSSRRRHPRFALGQREQDQREYGSKKSEPAVQRTAQAQQQTRCGRLPANHAFAVSKSLAKMPSTKSP